MTKIMKLKLRNLDLLGELMPALAELKSMRLNGRMAFNIVRSFKNGEAKVSDYEASRLSLLKAACKKDEAGEPVVEKNEFVFDSVEEKEKLTVEIKAIADQEIEVELYPIFAVDLEKMDQLSGDLVEKLMKFQFIIEN